MFQKNVCTLLVLAGMNKLPKEENVAARDKRVLATRTFTWHSSNLLAYFFGRLFNVAWEFKTRVFFLGGGEKLHRKNTGPFLGLAGLKVDVLHGANGSVTALKKWHP